jgi:hypothetical protein
MNAKVNMNTHGKFDIYLLAELSRLSDLPREDLISIGFLFEISKQSSPSDARKELDECLSAYFPSRLVEAHWESVDGLNEIYGTATITFAALEAIAKLKSIVEVQLCDDLPIRRPVGTRAPAARTSKAAEVPRSKANKIIAVVDHGCPFAHRALQRTGGTRVHAIWDQDFNPDFPIDSGTIPRGFGYGRQVNNEHLNAFIDGTKVRGQIDEDACYANAQYPAMRARASHGSLVLGLMAQARIQSTLDSVTPKQPTEDADVDIVFVQVPRSVPLAPTRGSVERCMLDGVRYVLMCAPDKATVSIVLDYGTEMGPHDGSSWFERALDQMVTEAETQRKITLTPVFCAGNGFLDSRNAVINPSKLPQDKKVAEFHWEVPRGSDTSSWLELWTKRESAPKVSVTGPGASAAVKIVRKKIGDDFVVLVGVEPTRFDPHLGMGAAGRWTISLEWENPSKASVVNAYTHWGGRNIGFPQRTWAPRFSAKPEMLKSKIIEIDGLGSVWGSTCGKKVTVAGGYEQWQPNNRSSYSSTGKTRDGRLKPDMHAVTEEFASTHGVLSITHRSSGLMRAKGTSFAAPQVARHLALNLNQLQSQANRKTAQTSESVQRRGFAKKRNDVDANPKNRI